MKKIISLLILFCLCFSFVSASVASEQSSSSIAYEGEGFATAEEAAIHYLEGLKALDMPKMIRSFAIETFVQNLDWKAYLMRGAGFSYSATIKFPGTQDIYQAINIESRKNEIVTGIFLQITAQIMPDVDFFTPIPLRDEAGVDEFLALYPMDADSFFQTIEIGECIDPAAFSDAYADERTQEHLDKNRQIYGADEFKGVPIRFSMDGREFILGCDAVRYGEKWYLYSLAGIMAQLVGASPRGGGIVEVLPE